MALDFDRGRRDTVFRHFNLWHDARTQLHPQQRHDAGARVDGGRGD